MQPTEKRRQLAGLIIKETSGVDHPANGPQVGGEGWLVMKADGSGLSPELAAAAREAAAKNAPTQEITVPDDEKTPLEKALASLDPEVAEAITKQFEAQDEKLGELTKARDDAEAARVAAEKAAKGSDERTDLQKALDNPDLDEVTKSVLQAQQVAIEKAQADATKAAAEAKVEKDARIDREFVAKADTLVDGLTTTADELAPILRAASESMTDEQFGSLETVLRAAAQNAKASDLFREVGKAGTPVAGGAEEAIRKAAVVLQGTEAGAGLTPEQAVLKVHDTRPDLVEALQKESR